MELAAQVQELISLFSKLPDADLAFASSLLAQYFKNRDNHKDQLLSPKQKPYIAHLILVAKGEAA